MGHLVIVCVTFLRTAKMFFSAYQVPPDIRNLPANAGDGRDSVSIPGLGRCPGGGNGNTLQILAWRIPWTGKPGRLQSMGSQRDTTKRLTHTHKLLFKVAASFNISINNVQGFQFSHICSNTSYCLFDYSYTIGCELVRHSGFICIYIVTESEKVGLKLNIQKT